MKAAKRYELRGFTKNARGRWVRVKTLTIFEDDAHSMAMQLWRLERAEGPPWRLEVRDNAHARGKLVPLVTYDELVRRAGSSTVASPSPPTGSDS